MQQLNLTPTQAILLHYLLTHHEQGNYGIDLCVNLGVSKATISSTLKTLKRNGYLYMKENPTDDRKKQIVLTQKAYDAQPQIEAELRAQRDLLCQSIPEQRRRWLEEDLEQMVSNLEKKTEQEATV